ncbi:MAG TPA: hypothetical protein VF587_08145 [Solirubrobacteraceae bacterium]
MFRLAALTTVAAAAAFAAPASAGASTTADPVPPCVKEVIQAAPGFAQSTVYNLANGEPPRIMGPFLPC